MSAIYILLNYLMIVSYELSTGTNYNNNSIDVQYSV